MALDIFWTTTAEKGLQKVVDYLEEEWTENEILNLENKLDELLERISKYPEICPKTSKHSRVYKGLIDKNNYIIYKVKPRKMAIDIINFRGTKQKPL
jgi:plasmid stabilization system protein ParE